jgi:hypothetical protein
MNQATDVPSAQLFESRSMCKFVLIIRLLKHISLKKYTLGRTLNRLTLLRGILHQASPQT